MADTKISAATSLTAPASTDEIPANSGGASKKITLANLAKAMPGYEIGYDQITADVTVSATTEASSTTIITCAAHTFDGAPVIATFSCYGLLNAAGTGNFIAVSLWEGATQIGRFCSVYTATSIGGLGVPGHGSIRFTPTAGAHTYTVAGHRGGANGTVQAGSGGTAGVLPAFIRFTKV